MEPPYWYYPIRQSLGAVLLQQGRAQEAAATFRMALEQAPRNGWALWGLMQAQRAAGMDAADTATAFEAAWLGDRSLLKLDRDRKSTRLTSSHYCASRMPSSA